MLSEAIKNSIRESVNAPRQGGSAERKEAIERWKRLQISLKTLHQEAHDFATGEVVKTLLSGGVSGEKGQSAVILHPKGNAYGNMLEKAGIAYFVDSEGTPVEKSENKRDRQLAVVDVSGFDGNGVARSVYAEAYAQYIQRNPIEDWAVRLNPAVC